MRFLLKPDGVTVSTSPGLDDVIEILQVVERSTDLQFMVERHVYGSRWRCMVQAYGVATAHRWGTVRRVGPGRYPHQHLRVSPLTPRHRCRWPTEVDDSRLRDPICDRKPWQYRVRIPRRVHGGKEGNAPSEQQCRQIGGQRRSTRREKVGPRLQGSQTTEIGPEDSTPLSTKNRSTPDGG